MRTANKILLHKILSDVKFIVAVILLTAFVSTILGYGFGYLNGQSDTRDYFMAFLNGRH